jgi:hypothetical protein
VWQITTINPHNFNPKVAKNVSCFGYAICKNIKGERQPSNRHDEFLTRDLVPLNPPPLLPHPWIQSKK